ncbi:MULTISPECIES: SDR family oxidoreductase [Bacillus cereus group]|nr:MULTISPECIES: SDR family oxidoreductase [Bacillus cereus group]MDR4984554.1 SDR family oxidoreductase [Bacillus cereus]MEA1010984.1 SDR family oxidoreductase [Bacillus cereus]
MKIFVAGATGGIGRSLLPMLIKKELQMIKHVSPLYPSWSEGCKNSLIV